MFPDNRAAICSVAHCIIISLVYEQKQITGLLTRLFFPPKLLLKQEKNIKNLLYKTKHDEMPNFDLIFKRTQALNHRWRFGSSRCSE